MTCQELVELVTDHLEGALPAHDQARFDAHLAECPGCARYVAQIRTTIDVVGATPALASQPEVSALLETFRGWKRGA